MMLPAALLLSLAVPLAFVLSQTIPTNPNGYTQAEGDALCEQLTGNPNDKWDPRGDNTTVKFCYYCCCGGGYKDPTDGSQTCCDLKDTAWQYNSNYQVGTCCNSSTVIMIDPPSAANDFKATPLCCLPSQVVQDGECWPPAPPDNGDGGCCNQGPECNGPDTCGPCAPKKVCPTKDSLGISYGKCYQLKYTDGTPLSREVANTGTVTIYQKYLDPSTLTLVEGLYFRVCRGTDCTATGPVGFSDLFTLEDMLGYLDSNTTITWIGNVQPHMGVISLPGTWPVSEFQAKPNCDGDGCALCLNLGTAGIYQVCPGPEYHMGEAPNPKYCRAYYFEEVPCSRDWTGTTPPTRVKAKVAKVEASHSHSHDHSHSSQQVEL